MYTSCGVQVRCVIGRLPPGKNPNREKVASPIKKTHWENWWVGFSSARWRNCVSSPPCVSCLLAHDDGDDVDDYADDGDADGDHDNVMAMCLHYTVHQLYTTANMILVVRINLHYMTEYV